MPTTTTHLARLSEKLIPSDNFPPITLNNTAPVTDKRTESIDIIFNLLKKMNTFLAFSGHRAVLVPDVLAVGRVLSAALLYKDVLHILQQCK